MIHNNDLRAASVLVSRIILLTPRTIANAPTNLTYTPMSQPFGPREKQLEKEPMKEICFLNLRTLFRGTARGRPLWSDARPRRVRRPGGRPPSRARYLLGGPRSQEPSTGGLWT